MSVALQIITVLAFVVGVLSLLMNLARTPPSVATQNMTEWKLYLASLPPVVRWFRRAVAFSTSALGRTLTGVLFTTGFGLLVIPQAIQRLDPRVVLTEATQGMQQMGPATGPQGGQPAPAGGRPSGGGGSGGTPPSGGSPSAGTPTVPLSVPAQRPAAEVPTVSNPPIYSDDYYRGFSDDSVRREVRDIVRELWRQAADFERDLDRKRLSQSSELEARLVSDRQRFYRTHWPRIRPLALELSSRLDRRFVAGSERRRQMIEQLDARHPFYNIFSEVGNWLFYMENDLK